jgi:hypothetical protein
MVQKSCTRVTIGIPKHEMFTIDQLVHKCFFSSAVPSKNGEISWENAKDDMGFIVF